MASVVHNLTEEHLTYQVWIRQGRGLFGLQQREWIFQCPLCRFNQSVESISALPPILSSSTPLQSLLFDLNIFPVDRLCYVCGFTANGVKGGLLASDKLVYHPTKGRFRIFPYLGESCFARQTK